jgi:hypothetical protein
MTVHDQRRIIKVPLKLLINFEKFTHEKRPKEELENC